MGWFCRWIAQSRIILLHCRTQRRSREHELFSGCAAGCAAPNGTQFSLPGEMISQSIAPYTENVKRFEINPARREWFSLRAVRQAIQSSSGVRHTARFFDDAAKSAPAVSFLSSDAVRAQT